MKAFLIASALAAALVIPVGSAEAAFPGANGKIVFTSNEGAFTRQLLTIEPDGSGRTNLRTPGNDPTWSPDGRRIAYTESFLYGSHIAIVTADGTGHFVPADIQTQDSEPSWSPDGGKIAFVRFVPDEPYFGAFEIFVMNADGTDQTRITHSPRPDDFALDATEPAWSPDGTKIAFTRTIPQAGNEPIDEEIYVMNADGSNLKRLTNNPSTTVLANDLSPAWSPDGRRIVFSSRRDGAWGVHVMNPDGSDVRRIADAPQASFPQWSPDGTRIVYANPPHDIFTVRGDGGDPRNLTDTPGVSELNPDWQPLNRPPDCSAVYATPNALWPPNHKLTPVTLAGATDPDGDTAALAISGVTGGGPGDAVAGPGPADVRLRADRGDTYAIAFVATDGRGGHCEGAVTVVVAHRL